MLRAAGPLLLLQPSCLLAMVALLPSAIAAPTPGSVTAVVFVATIAAAPLFVIVRRAFATA